MFSAANNVHPSEKTKNKITVIIIFLGEIGRGLFMFIFFLKCKIKPDSRYSNNKIFEKFVKEMTT